MAIKVAVFVVLAVLALACCVSSSSLESRLTRKVSKRSPQVVLEPATVEETSGLVIVPGCRTLPFPYINYCSYKQCWRLPTYTYQLVCYNAHHQLFPGFMPLAEMNEDEKPANLELNESAAKATEEEEKDRKLVKRSTDTMMDDTQDETNSIVILPRCRSLPFPFINYCSLRQCWRVPFTYRIICRNALSPVIVNGEQNESDEQSESSAEDK